MLSKLNFFCSGILRFKYIKISQIVGIFSEFKDVNHNIRRQAIQVFINLNHKEFYAFLVDWFFICILKNIIKHFQVTLWKIFFRYSSSTIYQSQDLSKDMFKRLFKIHAQWSGKLRRTCSQSQRQFQFEVNGSSKQTNVPGSR